MHYISMTMIGKDSLPRQGLPHVYSRIATARSDMAAIGRPGHCMYYTSMTMTSEEVTPGRCFPHAHRCITIARSDMLAIGRPGYCMYNGRTIPVDKHLT